MHEEDESALTTALCSLEKRVDPRSEPSGVWLLAGSIDECCESVRACGEALSSSITLGEARAAEQVRCF